MLERIDKTINSLCDCIQSAASKNVATAELAETTKALAALLIARASVAGTILQ